MIRTGTRGHCLVQSCRRPVTTVNYWDWDVEDARDREGHATDYCRGHGAREQDYDTERSQLVSRFEEIIVFEVGSEGWLAIECWLHELHWLCYGGRP